MVKMRSYYREITPYDYFVYFFYALSSSLLVVLFHAALFHDRPAKNTLPVKLAVIFLMVGIFGYVYKEFKRNFSYHPIKTLQDAQSSFELSKSFFTQEKVTFISTESPEKRILATVNRVGIFKKQMEIDILFFDQQILVNSHKPNNALFPSGNHPVVDQLVSFLNIRNEQSKL
jgi:hypothetical protein